MENLLNLAELFKKTKKGRTLNYEDQLKIDSDRDGKNFGRTLDKYLPVEYSHSINILDICSGILPEELELSDHFGVPIKNIVSVEKDPSMVSLSRKSGRSSAVVGNLSDKSFLPNLGKKFDLVIGRNVPVNPENSEDSYRFWLDIFKNIKDSMSNGGKILVTFLQEHELSVANKMLAEAGFTIQISEKNPHPVPSSIIGVSQEEKDCYVILAKVDSF